MRRLIPAVAIVLALAGGYAAGTARDEDPIRRVVIAGSTDQDEVGDKWVTAECPNGYTVIGGGAQIPHANETPGVALYWSAPYADSSVDVNGWWAAAQDSARKSRPWLLQVQAICLSGIVDEGGTALPPEIVSFGDTAP